MSSLRIVFAGTPDFSVPALQTLIDSKYEVIAVYTQPDRPAGRGQQLHASPVKVLAQACGISIYQPKTLKDAKAQDELRALKPDLMVVVAYGLILPQAVLDIPRFGCVNVHPSLLPRWRGAAPIQRTVEAGDVETGVTIMQLDAGMDTGPILKQEKITLVGDETSAKLHDQFAQLGATLLLDTIDGLVNQQIKPIPQDNNSATHAEKIRKDEALIDWTLPAKIIAQKVRAYNSWPVAYTTLHGERLRVWFAKADTMKTDLSPGVLVSIDNEAIYVATGDGVLKILSVQMPGKKQMSAAQFSQGHGNLLQVGETRFGEDAC